MDIIDRDEIERRLAHILGSELSDELDRLMGYLGNPPNLSNVPNEYWQNGWKDIQTVVEPVLMDLFVSQAESMLESIAVGIEWDMVNTAATSWASQHLENMLSDLFGKRYDHLNEVIPRFYEEGWNLDQLTEELERWYDPIRAEMIAITETTRAAVEGERWAVRLLEERWGILMIPSWQTANDEFVCPICGPKHDKPIRDGEYPPAHPRCRCWVTYEMQETE